jgi:hypothetical protein
MGEIAFRRGRRIAQHEMLIAIAVLVPVASAGAHIKLSLCARNRVIQRAKNCRAAFVFVQRLAKPISCLTQCGPESDVPRVHPQIEQTSRMLAGRCKVAMQSGFRPRDAHLKTFAWFAFDATDAPMISLAVSTWEEILRNLPNTLTEQFLNSFRVAHGCRVSL